jgi:hypothetical protein
MRWLLWLYPRRWRRRYGDEFLALVEERGFSAALVLDVLRGALDAWLHPEFGAARAPAGAAAAERGFDKFTSRSRTVLVLARQEAKRLQHQRIGTEHLLLGLVAEGHGLAADLLRERNVADLAELRQHIVHVLDQGGPHLRPLR